MTTQTHPARRRRDAPPAVARRVPEERGLRVPAGWYDPDSAAFDEPDESRPPDIETLRAETTPAEPGAILGTAAS
jgi:hypothetical protein